MSTLWQRFQTFRASRRAKLENEAAEDLAGGMSRQDVADERIEALSAIALHNDETMSEHVNDIMHS